MNMQNAPPAHLGPLFADKATAGSAGCEPVPHHERGEGNGGASRSRVFYNSVFGCEHSGIGSVAGRGKDEDAGQLLIRALDAPQTAKVDERAVDRLLIPYGNENGWVPGTYELRGNVHEIIQLEPQSLRTDTTIVDPSLFQRRRTEPN